MEDFSDDSSHKEYISPALEDISGDSSSIIEEGQSSPKEEAPAGVGEGLAGTNDRSEESIDVAASGREGGQEGVGSVAYGNGCGGRRRGRGGSGMATDTVAASGREGGREGFGSVANGNGRGGRRLGRVGSGNATDTVADSGREGGLAGGGSVANGRKNCPWWSTRRSRR